MSCLANESILENIYDEVLEELFDTGRISNYSQDDINSEVMRRFQDCLLYTSPSPRDATLSRMPSSA